MLISWWVAKIQWNFFVLPISQSKIQYVSAHQWVTSLQQKMSKFDPRRLMSFPQGYHVIICSCNAMKRKNRACDKWFCCFAVVISKCVHPRSANKQPCADPALWDSCPRVDMGLWPGALSKKRSYHAIEITDFSAQNNWWLGRGVRSVSRNKPFFLPHFVSVIIFIKSINEAHREATKPFSTVNAHTKSR